MGRIARLGRYVTDVRGAQSDLEAVQVLHRMLNEMYPDDALNRRRIAELKISLSNERDRRKQSDDRVDHIIMALEEILSEGMVTDDIRSRLEAAIDGTRYGDT
jgi:hypothetical protein